MDEKIFTRKEKLPMRIDEKNIGGTIDAKIHRIKAEHETESENEPLFGETEQEG